MGSDLNIGFDGGLDGIEFRGIAKYDKTFCLDASDLKFFDQGIEERQNQRGVAMNRNGDAIISDEELRGRNLRASNCSVNNFLDFGS